MDFSDIGESPNSSTSSSSELYICAHSPNLSWEVRSVIYSWILVAVVFIVSPLATILNVLVVVAVKQKEKLQTRSNVLLSSMAVADLLMGAVSMPLFAIAEILRVKRASFEVICTLDLVYIHLTSIFTFSSIYHVTFIAWERYVAVRKWMDYKVIVTEHRIRNLRVIAWLFAMIPFVIMMAIGVDNGTADKWYIATAVWMTICVITIVLFYFMVYLGLRSHNRNKINQVAGITRAKLESKVAKTTSLVTAALFLSFVPGIVLGVVIKVFPDLRKKSVFRVTAFLMMLNSLLNPLIYFYTNRRFRSAMLGLLKIRKPRETQPLTRPLRRKKVFASSEFVDRPAEKLKERGRLTRSMSFDTVFGLDFLRPLPCEFKLKKSIQVPPRTKRRSSCVISGRKQPSSYRITAESGERWMGKKYYKRRSTYVEELETENKLSYFARPAFRDQAVNLERGHRGSREITRKSSLSVRRSMPSHANICSSWYSSKRKQRLPPARKSATIYSESSRRRTRSKDHKIVELKTENTRSWLTRSASYNPTVVQERGHGGLREITRTRTLSVKRSKPSHANIAGSSWHKTRTHRENRCNDLFRKQSTWNEVKRPQSLRDGKRK